MMHCAPGKLATEPRATGRALPWHGDCLRGFVSPGLCGKCSSAHLKGWRRSGVLPPASEASLWVLLQVLGENESPELKVSFSGEVFRLCHLPGLTPASPGIPLVWHPWPPQPSESQSCNFCYSPVFVQGLRANNAGLFKFI